ncbi:hypothetical protein SARC_01933 [Sphaeroforma arctica JP610]|uniref:Uncharacterized protein n=1 Tax=Sphaeroforma arctica JP610 TaxID=667725 RepID=A0A0L0GA69_9EUKA|nr:hypothetical protein SARC_01933 [Sphaeroforma arctica JP610]KNC85895.1 hypothetical protein SARC_01933 [Sphaeroforma arctica JP610]|eukprot:XP_014159797.1 hypothetical protein SARC_01933 [Sphaeroforma arctica JP610]
MVADLPPHIRRVLTGKDVKQLSYVLLHPSVVATLIQLSMKQKVAMRKHATKRDEHVAQQLQERKNLVDADTPDAELESYDDACAEELKQADTETIRALDALVVEQQLALGQLKVPGFWVSQDRDVITVQMAILGCLSQLISGGV